MSVVIANVMRGGIVESCHHGNVVVTNSAGEIIAHAGDPEMLTYIRSAAKPIQAINVYKSGAMDTFSFNNKEQSLFCASHYGEDMHREVVQGMLNTMGYSLDNLLCGSPLSISPKYQQQQLRENHVLTPANSDCSGKHCGFLAVCKEKGYSVKDYDKLEHPMQQEILTILADFCDRDVKDFPIGIDGCGVPVHGMTLREAAMAYARFANPKFAKPEYEKACTGLYNAMNKEPEMLAGTEGFCTEFLKYTHGKFCGKLGAEAVYCIGVKDKDLGIVVKVEDGAYRALYPAVMHALKLLNLLSEEELNKLSSFMQPKIMNNCGATIGEIIPVFDF